MAKPSLNSVATEFNNITQQMNVLKNRRDELRKYLIENIFKMNEGSKSTKDFTIDYEVQDQERVVSKDELIEIFGSYDKAVQKGLIKDVESHRVKVSRKS